MSFTRSGGVARLLVEHVRSAARIVLLPPSYWFTTPPALRGFSHWVYGCTEGVGTLSRLVARIVISYRYMATQGCVPFVRRLSRFFSRSMWTWQVYFGLFPSSHGVGF
jgi:hypothetical protein